MSETNPSQTPELPTPPEVIATPPVSPAAIPPKKKTPDQKSTTLELLEIARSLLRRVLKSVGKEQKSGHDLLLEQALEADTMSENDCVLIYSISLVDKHGAVFTIRNTLPLTEIKNQPATALAEFATGFRNHIFMPAYKKFMVFIQTFVENGNQPLVPPTLINNGDSINGGTVGRPSGFASDPPQL